MSYCSSCGKELKNSTEEFFINGKIECHDCAYVHIKELAKQRLATQQKEASEIQSQKRNTQARVDYYQQFFKSDNSWASVLQAVGTINLILGVIISIVLAVVLGGISDNMAGMQDASFLVGILTFLLGTLITVVVSALLKCFATWAQDTSIIKKILLNQNQTEHK